MLTSKHNKKDKKVVNDNDKLVLMKDNPYTIFHALGKFLYNKSKHYIKSNLFRNQPENRKDRVVAL
jgi:rRNA-processing protein FCF1